MNVVFWLLVIVTLVAFWFLMSSAFGGIGSFFIGWIKDAKDGMSEEDTEDDGNEEREDF